MEAATTKQLVYDMLIANPDTWFSVRDMCQEVGKSTNAVYDALRTACTLYPEKFERKNIGGHQPNFVYRWIEVRASPL